MRFLFCNSGNSTSSDRGNPNNSWWSKVINHLVLRQDKIATLNKLKEMKKSGFLRLDKFRCVIKMEI